MGWLFQRLRPQPQWTNLWCTMPGRCAALVAAEGGIFLVEFFSLYPLSIPLIFPIFLFYTHTRSTPGTSSPSFLSLLLNHCDYFVLGSRTFDILALWFSDWFGFWIIDFVLLPHLNCPYVYSAMSSITENQAPASISVQFFLPWPWSAKRFPLL